MPDRRLYRVEILLQDGERGRGGRRPRCSVRWWADTIAEAKDEILRHLRRRGIDATIGEVMWLQDEQAAWYSHDAARIVEAVEAAR